MRVIVDRRAGQFQKSGKCQHKLLDQISMGSRSAAGFGLSLWVAWVLEHSEMKYPGKSQYISSLGCLYVVAVFLIGCQ